MRGSVLMLAAIALFALVDVTTKWLAAGYGAAQVIGLRCLVGLVVSGPLAARAGGIGLARLPLHLLRGALIIASAFAFFRAFAALPLFDAYIVFFLAPFLTMALAVAALGERVGARAWAWAGLGFAGVLVPVLPAVTGGGPVGGYVAALAGTFAYAGVMIVTRRLGTREGLAAAMAVPAALGTVVAMPFALIGWVAPGAADLALLLLNGVFWGLANLALTAAVRAAEPSRLAPLDFTAMVWALVFDATVFALAPGPVELVGAAVVIAACLGHQADQRRVRG